MPAAPAKLARTLEKIFDQKGVSIDWDAPDDLYFLGERQDLLEIAGNGMENAGKWCRSRVRVRAEVLYGFERLVELGEPPAHLKFAAESLIALLPFWRQIAEMALPANESIVAEIAHELRSNS